MDGPENGDTSGQARKAVTVSTIKAPPVYIAFVIQLLICVIAAFVVWQVLDTVAAYSVLLGGVINIVANSYFAWKVFRYRGASNTPLILKSFYAGETGKLIMTAVLFALVFAGIKPLNELAVIVGFIFTLVVGLIAAARFSMGRVEQTTNTKQSE